MSQDTTAQSIEQKRAALEEQLAALKAENAKLLKEQRSEWRLQVSEKGGVSVYGFGRFPVTLYPESMIKLLDHADEIKAFIAANKAQLDSIAKARKAAKAK